MIKINALLLEKNDLLLINPNTLTLPIFRSKKDSEIVKKIYRNIPILMHDHLKLNPWNVRFLQGLFNRTSDSKCFLTKEDLENAGFTLGLGAVFSKGEETYLPLYEGRMIHFFDHRRASMGTNETAVFRSGVTIETTEEEHVNPNYSVIPKYWVDKDTVESAIPGDYAYQWFIGFKDVTSSTNERTMICSILPRVAVSHKFRSF